MQSGVGLCEKFIHTCEQLTALFWPNYIPHKWEGGPYKPDHAINVHNRLKEVLSLRTLHKQLSQLLSVSEQTEMKMNKSFDPFDKLIPVQYSPYTGMSFLSFFIPFMISCVFFLQGIKMQYFAFRWLSLLLSQVFFLKNSPNLSCNTQKQGRCKPYF